MMDGLRLLPWTDPDGKPCYLAPDTAHPGALSLLADSVEVSQLGSAEEVLAGSRAVLADAAAGERAVRFALTRAVESLEDVLRIAVSRGQRIAGTAVMLHVQDGRAAPPRALQQRCDPRQHALAVMGLRRVHEHAALQVDDEQSRCHPGVLLSNTEAGLYHRRRQRQESFGAADRHAVLAPRPNPAIVAL